MAEDECQLPDPEMVKKIISHGNHMRVEAASKMCISEKRKCFHAMRTFHVNIEPCFVYSPLGLTIADISISSILFK